MELKYETHSASSVDENGKKHEGGLCALCQGIGQNRYHAPLGPPEDWHWSQSWVPARPEDLANVTCELCHGLLVIRIERSEAKALKAKADEGRKSRVDQDRE